MSCALSWSPTNHCEGIEKNDSIQYFISYRMVFYVTVVTFLMTLLMSKYYKDVIPISHPFIRFWYILHLYIHVNEMLSWMIEISMKKHFVSDTNCNIANL